MLKFLLDENLSHETVAYLHTLGYEAKTAKDVGLSHTEDKNIIQYAVDHGYLIVTFDVEYGYLFRILSPHVLGIIVLRLEDQTVASANRTLKRLLNSGVLQDEENQNALIIVDESTIRVRK